MRGLAMAVAAALFTACAQASFVQFTSNESATGRGSYTGTMEWVHSEGAGSGTLRVTFTNTSALANGGFLTAFGFNTAQGASALFSSELNGTARRWRALSNFTVRGFGTFDSGAGLGGRWRNGTSPIYGISVGRTKGFEFDVFGDPELLAAMTVDSLIDESNGIGVIARFRGFDDGGTDTVTARLPAPGAFAVLGLGLGVFRRRAR